MTVLLFSQLTICQPWRPRWHPGVLVLPPYIEWVMMSGWMSHPVPEETPDVCWPRCPVSQTRGLECSIYKLIAHQTLPVTVPGLVGDSEKLWTQLLPSGPEGETDRLLGNFSSLGHAGMGRPNSG